jgi:Tfp pilus assembly protein PilF
MINLETMKPAILFNYLIVLIFSFPAVSASTLADTAVKKYAGDKICQQCHLNEYQQWQGSHHELAMQQANNKTVLADFHQAVFNNDGIVTTFFKRDKRFIVNTEDETGKLKDFEIAYTFGVYPLQQYMVKFPEGRVQVLDIAWDTRTKAQGGQRWFSLHPEENIKAGDVLHWTGPNMNWNYMCADCHSTNLKKNYNPVDKTYSTQWQAINVSCEACHGPAAEHIQWAEEKADSIDKGLTINFPATGNRHWLINKETQKPYLSSDQLSSHSEIELCAKCHSRRSQFSDDFIPGDRFRDHYLPSMLTDTLYYPDGKIKDEVYVYGSFKQSKMYQSGVICSDCHNAHTLELKSDGDTVCQSCHLSSNYATEKHHFHKQGTAGSSCIACHMPAKIYMGVDERNDHSFRIPRPDLSQKLATENKLVENELPNACTNCHKDKSSLWAASAIASKMASEIKKSPGKTARGYQQFSPALHAIATQSESALTEIYNALLGDTPDIARASIVSHLGDYPTQQTLMTSLQMLKSSDADIRRAALQSLEAFPIQYSLKYIFPALEDPVKTVRLEAVRILLTIPQGAMQKEQKELLEKVTEEYLQSLLFVAERPEAQLALAQLYQSRGEIKQAETALQEALRLQDQYVPAYVNYASFLRQQGRETDAYEILQKGIKVTNGAALYHSMGLWYVRNRGKDKGMEYLQQAAEMETDNPRYQYVYAVAVGDEHPEQAIKILQSSLQKHSGNLDTLTALVSYSQQLGDQLNVDKYRGKIDRVMSYK